MLPKLPQNIDYFIGNSTLIPDEIGESPGSVYSFIRGNDRFFLKYSPVVYANTTYSVMREVSVLNWLNGRLNVPEVACVAENSEGEFMITRCIPGEPLYTRINAQQPVLELFREAVYQMQSVSIIDCPFDSGVNFRLQELEYLLNNDLCAEEYDLGQWPGIETPQDLLVHLRATLPSEERVFSHGDLCDCNIFVDAHDELYFLDLGRSGIADRWLDIAFVHRNLREEVSISAATEFLDTLGGLDNSAKRVFFEQLDELF
ncbi:aminoglycoside 3'-phosphotransferase [Xenorhabdus sp. Flor]|uniref:APH(3') family aminoglycoside O-phosphotransferase n=1 Tax=Xenorhabdus cabanillasii TaxID=351673 RepID=UPI0019C45875|nr:APH(3') family aminoglycoside O-phosphotransferase [Xenorhabdus sp. Flor]MBD2814796.1 aminoglycoside 3'-phosphotransferase [Xenorhabdus sp. Flor]